MYFSREIDSSSQPQQISQHQEHDKSTPIIIISSSVSIKSPQSHQQSTPLSINKTQQSNFNLYQQGLLLNQQHQMPNLSPVSDHRPLTKSFTPYPMWHTTQEGKGWKMREDSFAVFDECYDEESDKENIFCGVNEQDKWRKRKQGQQEELTAKSYRMPFQEQQQNICQSKQSRSNKKHLSLQKSNMRRSMQRTLNCSNIKTTLDLPDGLLLPSSMDSQNFVSLDNMRSRQSQGMRNALNEALINIQQPSPSSSYSSCGMVGNVQMILSEVPKESQQGNSLSMDGSSKDSNQMIDYFLTQQDEERQSSNMSKHPIIQNSTNPIDYCSMLSTKIQQLSNNIAILHQKVVLSGGKGQYSINNINSQFFSEENKIYPSTMESLYSRHAKDGSNSVTINNHNKQLLCEKSPQKKHRNKLIYPDSKIIYSQNDSGYQSFSEQFSQVLMDSNDLCNGDGMNKSLRSQSNVRIIVHNENSPVSIDIQEQMNNLLGWGSGKSERINNSEEKSHNRNLFGREQLQQDIVLEDECYFTNGKDENVDISLSSSGPIEKESFRLSFPQVYTQNQQQMQCSYQQSSPKLKSHQSFMSQSSNQTFIQQQISNKKFNNKFNQWLMMS